MNKTLGSIIAIVLGLVAIGFGVYTQFFQTKGFEQTTATITQIDQTWKGYNDETMEDEYDYTVYVKYTVDGKEYTGKADTYDGSYVEGKEITVYYNPSNPADIHGDSGILGFIMIGIGVVLVVAGAFLLIKRVA